MHGNEQLFAAALQQRPQLCKERSPVGRALGPEIGAHTLKGVVDAGAQDLPAKRAAFPDRRRGRIAEGHQPALGLTRAAAVEAAVFSDLIGQVRCAERQACRFAVVLRRHGQINLQIHSPLFRATIDDILVSGSEFCFQIM